MQKGLFCLLHSALLFNKKLVKDLEEYRFLINPYDPYVAKNMIKNKHMEVVWHMDNLKVSHINSF